MQFIPYDIPLLPEYRAKSFTKKLRVWQHRIEPNLIPGSPFCRASRGVWVYFRSHHSQLIPQKIRVKRYWGPKLYVCVRSSNYWPLISRLMHLAPKWGYQWKFYMPENPFGYERPDKIVFYASSERDLRRLILLLRPQLKECSFHPLRHAVLSSEMKLESVGKKGIFVGCDPHFLKYGSWRIYRSHCMAWASLNEKYLDSLPGGRSEWFRKMNLSLSHEGPWTLEPDPSNIPCIKRFWRIMNQLRP